MLKILKKGLISTITQSLSLQQHITAELQLQQLHLELFPGTPPQTLLTGSKLQMINIRLRVSIQEGTILLMQQKGATPPLGMDILVVKNGKRICQGLLTLDLILQPSLISGETSEGGKKNNLLDHLKMYLLISPHRL